MHLKTLDITLKAIKTRLKIIKIKIKIKMYLVISLTKT